jgi:virginiamycin B lyase
LDDPTTTVEHPPLGAPDAGVIDDARAHQRRQWVASAAAAGAAALVVLLIVLAGRGRAGSGVGFAAAGEPVALASRHAVTEVHVPAGAEDLVAGDGAVWVAGVGAVSRIDPASGRVVATISTPLTGEWSHVAAGDGSIWITSGLDGGRGVVYRIDPSSDRVVAAIAVGGTVVGIAVGAGSAWVTRPEDGPGEVVRIEARTNRVTGAPIKVGPGPLQVTYGQGAVWVQNTSPPSAMRIDPTTGRVSAAPVVGAVGYGSLWAAVDDSLWRVDPRTGRVLASVHLPRAQAVAAGGAVWVLAAPGWTALTWHAAAIWEVDPNSNRVIGTPVALDLQQPIAVAATANDIWVAGGYMKGTVTRIPLIRCRNARCT